MKIKLNIKSIILMTAIVLASMLFINISFAADTGKVTVETAKLREKASTDSQVLDLVSKDEKVDILSEDNDWYKVKYKTTTGYIRKDLIQVENKESLGNVTNENTTKNTTNNTTENTQVANGTNEENKTSENVTNETNNTTEQSTETLNIEKNSKYKLKENVKIKVIPLISSIELDEVKKDDEVEVVEILNDWVRVRLSNQKEGWIRKDKLTNIQTETAKVENTENTTTSRDEQQLTSRGSTTSREETTKNTTSSTTKNAAKTTAAKSTNTKSTTKTNTSKAASTAKTTTITESTSTSASGSAVATYAKQYVGCRYVSGGTSPSGFDCSGFTTYVYKHFGVTLNRTAAGQYSNGKAVTSLQAGDLVMFSYGKGISHVGIYIGGNQFVHAANSRSGVRVDSLSGSYKSRFVGARRIF